QRYDADGKPVGNATALVEGGAGNDTLTWIGSDDVILRGGEGDDILTGGAGDDVLMGEGGNNTALYSEDSSEFTFSIGQDGNLQLSSNASGTDTLIDIENFEFADGTITLDTKTADNNDAPAPNERGELTYTVSGGRIIIKHNDGGATYEVGIRDQDAYLADENMSSAKLSNGTFVFAWSESTPQYSDWYYENFDPNDPMMNPDDHLDGSTDKTFFTFLGTDTTFTLGNAKHSVSEPDVIALDNGNFV